MTQDREEALQAPTQPEVVHPDHDSPTPQERYELNLRKLGAWLDAVLAYRVTLTEVPHGFVVRYHRRDLEPVFVERFFPHGEITGLRLGDLRLRRRLAGRLGNRLQGVALEPGGYQDLFRALGHELDRMGARLSVIREDSREDRLSLSCETLDGPYETALGSEERADLRQQARGRRQRGRGWRPWG